MGQIVKKKIFKRRETFKVAEVISTLKLSRKSLKANIENLRFADNFMRKIEEVQKHELSYCQQGNLPK